MSSVFFVQQQTCRKSRFLRVVKLKLKECLFYDDDAACFSEFVSVFVGSRRVEFCCCFIAVFEFFVKDGFVGEGDSVGFCVFVGPLDGRSCFDGGASRYVGSADDVYGG